MPVPTPLLTASGSRINSTPRKRNYGSQSRRSLSGASGKLTASSSWPAREVTCWLSGSVVMTIRVRALSGDEAEELARMTRSRSLGAGLVRRAQIVQHAVQEGLSAPEIAARMGLCGATVRGVGA